MKRIYGGKFAEVVFRHLFAGSFSASVRFGGLIFLCFLTACSELEKPKTEPFYSQTAPPPKKEFRWSNGRMPTSFDPARAAAPPETDVVRAIFEGLTDTDSKTLEIIPAVALDWKSSEDFKTWTFNLRKDAKWSNGERVTARQFVGSWKRLANLGNQVVHRKLLENIVGMQVSDPEDELIPEAGSDVFEEPVVRQDFLKKPVNANISIEPPGKNEVQNSNSNANTSSDKNPPRKTPTPVKFGAEALDNFTLRVSLIKPDKNFPALVAHPLFRPIYGDGRDFENGKLNANIVTNGAFRIASVGQDGVTLDRAEHFWGKDRIELERVRFVPKETAEKALEAYRLGEIDALTNAHFEPLALKLLKPFGDFRQITHSALNFYEFNRNKPPFDKREVREALSIAIERERLTEDEMDGVTKPAFSFLPFNEDSPHKISQDPEKARQLLASAGFPDGENFPVVKIVVNRNNIQQRIARAIAKMWERNLGIKTEIIVRESADIELVRETGDFDVLRRGVVLPTSDETAAMWAIFAPAATLENQAVENPITAGEDKPITEKNVAKTPTDSTDPAAKNAETAQLEEIETVTVGPRPEDKIILTEEQALAEIPAIPLYFPTSYSLVKPYIQGFDINVLDAPSLKDVRIDNNWQPKKPKGES